MGLETPKSPLQNFEKLEAEFESQRALLSAAISESSAKLSDIANQNLEEARRFFDFTEQPAVRIFNIISIFSDTVATYDRKRTDDPYEALVGKIYQLILEGQSLLDRKAQLGREIEHYQKRK